ncbi:hypothetical protein Wildcat_18 [Mycobacterium phage Wildcat]|uniref:Uncharacterized protein n=4 Tax=Mycobacterium virus Wildcat TaxID=1993859 RepID=Q19Y42_9CAUD|nr:hypothetical protein Wildcat_18 [Mycobacterium phage Wildcat]ABE67623.1 hypothetical protein Wildcat_18 [Mycobacterium phage Wildcat]AJD82090.1 hypothetical protein COSMO_18 [Mycobacterium phage Cosmo]AQT25690.2 hypothetical protein EniyanLRS_15 [Mycobacterium phage EniyanLRS]QGJ89908.1 hypothetical protein PBI_MARYV_18 [Mycobacterium phage MaryV]
MSCPGLILSPTLQFGDQLKAELRLRFWYVTSPRSIRQGGARGLIIDPHVIILQDPGVPHGMEMFRQCWTSLAPSFPESPTLYLVTRAPFLPGDTPPDLRR